LRVLNFSVKIGQKLVEPSRIEKPVNLAQNDNLGNKKGDSLKIKNYTSEENL
jgi:hypothetical protein